MIAPYEHRRPHASVGLLARSGRVLGESRHPDVVYVPATRVGQMLVAGEGEAVCWNGAPIRYLYGDVEAVVVHADFPPDREAIAALISWRDGLERYGARPRSIGSAAWSLLRATLTAPIRTSLGPHPVKGHVVGGRQETGRGPGTYFNATHHDLEASYAATLARLVYGGAWDLRPDLADLRQIARLTAAGHPIFVSAEVRLRGGGPGPLPRRPRSRRTPAEQILLPVDYPQGPGTLRGYWTGAEVVAAAEVATVKIRDVWCHGAPSRPFEPWWYAVRYLRSLDGFAGTLGKMTGNALWGQLAISAGERQRLTFRRGRREVRADPLAGTGRPRIYDLAETVTGTVRARLFRDLISPAGAALVCAHTDGGWTLPGFAPIGDGWRVKDRARVLDVCNPQGLAWRRDDGSLHYALAGTPARHAAVAFREIWSETVGGRAPTLSRRWRPDGTLSPLPTGREREDP